MRMLTKLIAFALVAWVTAEVITYAYRRGANDGADRTVAVLLERPDWALTVASSSVLRYVRSHREDDDESPVDRAWEGATR